MGIDHDDNLPDRPRLPAQTSAEELVNERGVTWTEHSRQLEKKLAHLSPDKRARHLRIHKEIFKRHMHPTPMAVERRRLFQEAYDAVSPEQRQHFLDTLKL